MGPVSYGYENLTPYLEGVCSQWRPARIDLVGRVTRGVSLDSRARLRVCDLACGTGLSALIHAAANPQHEVVGIDFNPTHIAHARRRAEQAGLSNIRFYNRGIEELSDLGLAEFDLITISGAYSWLAPEVRRAVRAFVRRHLRPGGLFGAHYMTQPGWGSIEPLWKIARDIAAPGENNPGKRHAATVALLKGLTQTAFIKNHPIAARRIDKIVEMKPEGFAHEYLTAHWRPEYHVDVAHAFAEEAGLVYVGDCFNLWRNVPALSVPKSAQQLLAGIIDPALRETVYDYVVMALDRHGLFHKGQIPGGQPVGDLGDLTLGTLGAFGRKLPDGIAAPIGKIQLKGERFEAVITALTAGSRTVREIATSPACAKLERKAVVEAIGLLAAGEFIVPFAKKTATIDPAGVSKFRLSPFNAEQFRRPARQGAYALASPALGHALVLGELDACFAAGLAAVARAGMDGWLKQRFAKATMTRKDGTTLAGDDLIQYLAGEFDVFCRDKLPKLLELEVLLPS